MKNLLRILDFIKEYEFDSEIQRVPDSWLADWRDKPTTGEMRAAEQELIELGKRLIDYENLLRPFAEAYRLHLRDDKPVTQLEMAMSMNTSVDDWRAAFVELYGEPVVKNEEVV